jgi:hypothetical protein
VNRRCKRFKRFKRGKEVKGVKGLPCFADPANLIEPKEPEAPRGETPLELLQAVYRNAQQPLSARMRAAALAIPFEAPKLAVTAYVAEDNFAERLERALARSQNGRLIEHRGEGE